MLEKGGEKWCMSEDVRSAQPCCLCVVAGGRAVCCVLWCVQMGWWALALAAVTGKGFERLQRRLVVRCI